MLSGHEEFETTFFLRFKNPATEKLYQHHLVSSTKFSVRCICFLQLLFTSLLSNEAPLSRISQLHIQVLFFICILATFAIKRRYTVLQAVLVS